MVHKNSLLNLLKKSYIKLNICFKTYEIFMATFMAFKGDSTIGIIPTTPCTRIVIFFFTISALTIKKICIFPIIPQE